MFEPTGTVDDTTVQLEGNVEVASVSGAYQLIPGIALSWKVFNLRLGAGYGNFFIPRSDFARSAPVFLVVHLRL